MKSLSGTAIIFVALIGLSVSGLAKAEEKRCIFSAKIVDAGGGLRAMGSGGEIPSSRIGDGVFVYETSGGSIIEENHVGNSKEIINAGPQYSAKIRAAFSKAGLPNFDFSHAVEEVVSKIRAGQKREEAAIEVTIGAKQYEVYANFEGTNFKFNCEHLGTALREYAKVTPELNRFQDLLDCLEVSF